MTKTDKLYAFLDSVDDQTDSSCEHAVIDHLRDVLSNDEIKEDEKIEVALDELHAFIDVAKDLMGGIKLITKGGQNDRINGE